MSDDNIRPDPDELLKSLQKARQKESGGKLKIFLGMSAGVGKTYAMLKAAHALIADGSDVVAGIVETHRRAETLKLLENIPELPRIKLQYRDREFDELDIDALLKRRPQYALVDELAHTNVPGSRHEKRWQDITELLDHGINVYTTLNIQHVESRKEDVELATGVSIRETVPDSVIERAEQIELVDIPPETLLERLEEGKVYLGDKAARAADNFFRQDKLTALREIALRFAGDVVGNELRELSGAGKTSGASHEKIMVAVSHSPHSRRLIRAARKMAFTAEADWLVLHVDTGIPLAAEDKNRLSENIEFARNLGAAVISTTDPDLVAAIARIGRQHGVTKILIGRPKGKFFGKLGGPSILDRLLNETDIDIHVLHDNQAPPGGSSERFYLPFSRLAGRKPYQSSIILITAVTLLGVLLAPAASYQSIGFLYLLAVLASGAFLTLGPVLLSSILSVVAWDYFFIPPKYTLFISRPEDILMCITYLLVAGITGLLSHRIIRGQQLLRAKEKSSEAMLDILAQFAFQSRREDCLHGVLARMRVLFDGSFEVVFSRGGMDNETTASASVRWLSDAREWAVAKWTIDNGKEAGWSTDTLSSSQALYIPLIAHGKVTGALSYLPNNHETQLAEDSKSLLLAICGQLAFYLEQEIYREQAQNAEEFKRSEKLYQAILNSVSHELKTPITAIIGLVSALEDEKIASAGEARRPILDELSEAAQRLNREVTNILDMSRLSSGLLKIKKEWFDLRELADDCAAIAGPRLGSHKLEMHIPDGLPFMHADYALLEQTLSNLLSNAISYTQPDSVIKVSAVQRGNALELRVADSGHGIPKEYLDKVFDRFFRVPGTPAGGTGLGLAIAKTVVELHGGSISAANREDGGAEFLISLPVEEQPKLEGKK
jgi:two-component system sensor histidine kinase KdpD